MDFGLTKPQKNIQKAARDFAKGEFDKEECLDLERNYQFPEKIWKKAAELGFIGIHFPEAYSGGGMGLFENCMIIEEFCRKDSTVGGALALASYASECIVRFGSDAQKEYFLPKIAEGQILSGGAFTEPNVGADLNNLKTTALKKGEEWVINGQKTLVKNGGNAGIYIVLCRSGSETNMILVEGDRKGVAFNDAGERIGNRMISLAHATFTNLRVPESNLIGKEGHGLSQVKSFYNESKIMYAAQAVGTAIGAFDRAMSYIKQREQFGRAIAKFQITQHKMAEMAAKIETARLITYEAALNMDNGKIDPKLAPMAKMVAARAAVEVTDAALQLFGGYGYMVEQEIEGYYRDAKAIELSEGTPIAQKDAVAQAIIGKLK